MDEIITNLEQAFEKNCKEGESKSPSFLYIEVKQ